MTTRPRKLLPAERLALTSRILTLGKEDPPLPSTVIAERCGVGVVFVRKVLKEAKSAAEDTGATT